MRFKKKFGQNFLINESVVEKIVSYIPKTVQKVTEIGAGHGALTKTLSKNNFEVEALEIDSECISFLELLNLKGVKIIETDVLYYKNFNEFVIGNLPYNISVKLIENFLYTPIKEGIFMVQKEVGQVLTGNDYQKLTILIQSAYEVKKLFDLKPGNFFPIPKIHSQVIHLKKKEVLLNMSLEKLKYILFACFSQRRKKLTHLKKNFQDVLQILLNNEINVQLRAEEISKEEYYNLKTEEV